METHEVNHVDHANYMHWFSLVDFCKRLERTSAYSANFRYYVYEGRSQSFEPGYLLRHFWAVNCYRP